jgi:hypothetical protein
LTDDKAEFVWWWCKQGHRMKQREDCLEVWCHRCMHDATIKTDPRMRQVSLFPTFGSGKFTTVKQESVIV